MFKIKSKELGKQCWQVLVQESIGEKIHRS